MPYLAPTNGTPADTYGADGDTTVDYANRFFYGPKGAVTAGSWSGTGKNMTGPTGPINPASIPVLGSPATTYGSAAQFNGQTVGTSNTPMFFPGTSIPHTFTPQSNTALTGLAVSNYSASGATIFFYLYNLTDGAIVYNYNSGNGIANNTSAAITLAPTAVPLTAGKTYQWQAQRVTAAATSLQVSPQYLTPAQNGTSVSTYSTNFVHATSITLSTNGVLMQPAGISAANADRGYYRNALASFLYSINYTIVGSGSTSLVLSDGTVVLYTSPTITPTASGTSGTFGPFGVNTAYIKPGQQCYWYTQGSGGSVTANLVMSVCQ